MVRKILKGSPNRHFFLPNKSRLVFFLISAVSENEYHTINTIEIGLIWEGKTYLKNAASFMTRVIWEMRVLLTARIRSFKRVIVGLCRSNGCQATSCRGLSLGHIDHLHSLAGHQLTALWPTETHNNSLERSKPQC